MLREHLLRQWARRGRPLADLDEVGRGGWPDVDLRAVSSATEGGATRRSLLAAGGALAGVAALGAGAWGLARAGARDGDDAARARGVLETRSLKIGNLEVRLDHVRDDLGERIQCSADGALVTSLPLVAGPHVTTAPIPTRDSQKLALSITGPAPWVHVGGAGAPQGLHLTTLGGRTVGVTRLSTLDLVLGLTMATRENTVVAWPDPETPVGVRFERANIWAYSWGGNVLVRGSEIVQATLAVGDDSSLVVGTIAGCRVLFVQGLDGDAGPSVTGVPRALVEIRHADAGGWFVLLLPEAADMTARVTFTGWEGKPKTLRVP